MKYLLIFLLFPLTAHAAQIEIGEAVTITASANVNNSILIEAGMIYSEIQATSNGEPVPYTVIMDEVTGEKTVIVNGE